MVGFDILVDGDTRRARDDGALLNITRCMDRILNGGRARRLLVRVRAAGFWNQARCCNAPGVARWLLELRANCIATFRAASGCRCTRKPRGQAFGAYACCLATFVLARRRILVCGLGLRVLFSIGPELSASSRRGNGMVYLRARPSLASRINRWRHCKAPKQRHQRRRSTRALFMAATRFVVARERWQLAGFKISFMGFSGT